MSLCSVRQASSCCRTTFSVIFYIKERVETSRKFSNVFGPREAFLRRGLTTADLKVDGKVPDDKEKLMMFVRVGNRSSINSGRSDVGRGSNEQEVGFDFKIVAFSSASVFG